MNYELAKQLKDAGFLQYGYNRDIDGSLVTLDSSIGEIHDINVYVPTLSELIEACGDGYFTLQHHQTGWQATMVLIDLWLNGKTPEEAVARLWLALNSTP